MAQAEDVNRTTPIQFPWANTDDEIVANFAVGGLRESLMLWLKTERGIQAETLVVSIGALAGCAAQCALWDEIAKSGRPVPQFDPANPTAEHGLIYYATSRGETFYAGELLNRYLVFEGGLGAMIHCGHLFAPPPSNAACRNRICQTMERCSGGTDAFGIPRAPADHQHHLTPRQAPDLFWPRAKYILTRTDGHGPAKGRSVQPKYWPLVVALVASQFIALIKDTLHQRLALTLMMESAIAMSKVDRKTVPEAMPPDKNRQRVLRMIYETRVYRCLPGRLPALTKTLRDHHVETARAVKDFLTRTALALLSGIP